MFIRIYNKIVEWFCERGAKLGIVGSPIDSRYILRNFPRPVRRIGVEAAALRVAENGTFWWALGRPWVALMIWAYVAACLAEWVFQANGLMPEYRWAYFIVMVLIGVAFGVVYAVFTFPRAKKGAVWVVDLEYWLGLLVNISAKARKEGWENVPDDWIRKAGQIGVKLVKGWKPSSFRWSSRWGYEVAMAVLNDMVKDGLVKCKEEGKIREGILIVLWYMWAFSRDGVKAKDNNILELVFLMENFPEEAKRVFSKTGENVLLALGGRDVTINPGKTRIEDYPGGGVINMLIRLCQERNPEVDVSKCGNLAWGYSYISGTLVLKELERKGLAKVSLRGQGFEYFKQQVTEEVEPIVNPLTSVFGPGGVLAWALRAGNNEGK